MATTLVELRKLINESRLPDRTKQWALRRAATFKRPSKLQEWFNKFRNLNAERANVTNRRQFQAYRPTYTEVTINVHKERNNPVWLAFGVHEDGYAPEDTDRTLILPIWFVNQLHNGFQPDAKDFIEKAMAIAPQTSLDQLATIENFLASGNIRIKVKGINALPPQLSARHARSPRDRLLRDGDRRLTHPWLRYTASLDADNFAEMFANPKYYYEGGCMYTAIMNTWADKWNNRPKKQTSVFGRPRIPDITPESIHSIVFPGKPFALTPMSFTQAKAFFAHYKVKARAYFNSQLVDEFTPATQNKTLERTLVIIIKDDHAHHVADPKVIENISKREQHVGTMSSKYSITKGEAPRFVGTVASLDDLFRQAQVLSRNTSHDLNLRFLWRNDKVTLMNAVEDIFNKHHWLVKVQMGSNDQVTSFSMVWNNVHVTVVTPDFGQFARTSLYDLSLKQIQETYDLQHELRKCNGRNLLSKYAPGFAETLKALRAAPPYCKFGNIANGTYDCVDQVKCYTTIIEETPMFPRFSRYDRFEPYDGHIIEPLTLYVVAFKGKRTKATNCEFPSTVCLKFGKYLAGHKVAIDSYCRSSHLVRNPYLEQLKLIEQSELPREITKMLTNANWGCLGKVRNTKKTAELCSTLEDAQALNTPEDPADGPRGLITQIAGTPFFKFTIHNQAELTEGFLPIQQLIYDEARHRLAQLILVCGEDNVLGVHTDCVYVKQLPVTLPPKCRFEVNHSGS